MTVWDLRRRMSNGEFVRWRVYYGRLAQEQDLDQKLHGGG